MAITLPDDPRLANDTERRVWTALIAQLGDGDLVIAGQRVTDQLKDHEIDFVVAIEGAGIVCVEVKGGEVTHDGDTWLQHLRSGQIKIIDPVRQVRQARYALRDFIEKDPRWTQGRVRWNHVVVLPNSEFSQDFAVTDCPRWMVVDRDDFPNVVGRIRDIALNQETELPLLTAKGIEELRIALGGRGLPQRDVVARALENEDAANILTDRQAVILDAIQLLTRVEVRGGAGSGKTFMAL